jgi:hypothetical protein
MQATAQTLRRLAQLTNFSQRQVLLGFAGVVLKTWAGRTKVATQARTDRSSRLHAVRSLQYTKGSERGDVTVNAGFKPAPFGRVWIRVREGAGKNNWILAKGPNFSAPTGSATFTMYRRKFYNGGDTDRSTSFQWMQNVNYAQTNVEHKLPISIKKGRRSIGLSRQSVLQIADALGIDLLRVEGGGALAAAGIAKARNALASSGKAFRNGFGSQGGNETRAYVDLVNRLPYGRAIGMDRTLLGVLAGQNKYFAQSYAKGAFNSQKRAVAAYPNLFRFRAAA